MRGWAGRRRLRLWLVITVACVALTFGLSELSVPSPWLFAGLVIGLTVGLWAPDRVDVPRPVGHGAFAVTGVVTGQLLSAEVLRSVAADGMAVGVSLISTLVLTMAGGYLLAAITPLDRPTAVFGMIAGGASGVIAASEDGGADPRLVAVMQYLRVLLVLVAMPVVTSVQHAGDAGGTGVATASGTPVVPGAVFCIVAVLAGGALAHLVRLPSGWLLGPMVLVAAVAIGAPSVVEPAPLAFQDVAFLVIGLQVGLRFDRDQVRLVARSLPAIVATITVLILGCAALGLGMSAVTSRPYLDCYLATTPGGLYAVLAAAVQSGADGAFVTSAQVLRLFVMLLAAPALGWLIRRSETPQPTPSGSEPPRPFPECS